MLNIYLGDMENAIYHPPVYFDNTYEDEWITDELSVKMIKDIDKSEVLGENCIESPILGQISPKDLSGGAKTLMLIYNNPNLVINASACGDNCVKWLLQMAEEKDIFIRLLHNMNFGTAFTIKVMNTNQVVHTMPELIQINSDILRG